MATLRLACFWPGLIAAWHRGLARGLFVAVLFSWSLCVLLLATFVWPGWLAATLVRILWCAIGIVWAVESVRGFMRIRSLLETSSPATSEVFIQAQQEYVRGNWFDAEALLLEIVHQHPRDAESLLLLVGVLRHTRRWQPALRRLEQLELLDNASPWRFEIQQERTLIASGIAEDVRIEDGGQESLGPPDAKSLESESAGPSELGGEPVEVDANEFGDRETGE